MLQILLFQPCFCLVILENYVTLYTLGLVLVTVFVLLELVMLVLLAFLFLFVLLLLLLVLFLVMVLLVVVVVCMDVVAVTFVVVLVFWNHHILLLQNLSLLIFPMMYYQDTYHLFSTNYL